jgi:hypothetical protein
LIRSGEFDPVWSSQMLGSLCPSGNSFPLAYRLRAAAESQR